MPETHTTDTEATRSDSGGEHPDDASPSWGTTAFEPGGDVGLVARDTVGLIARDNPSTRARLWKLVAADAPLDDILDELSSTGLKALPDFGLAQVEGAAIRVVARGRTKITAELGSGATHEIDASGVRTWIEELVDDVAGISIGLPTDDDAGSASEAFAVLAGSVPASSLSRRYDEADTHAAIAESGAGWTTGGAEGPAAVSVVEAELASTADVEPGTLDDLDDLDQPASADVDHDAGRGAADAPVDTTDDPAPAEPVGATGPRAGAPPADPKPASPQPPPPGAIPAGATPDGSAADVAPQSSATPAPDTPDGPATSIFDDDFDDHAAGSVTDVMPIHDGVKSAPDVDARQAIASAHGVLAFSNGERIELDRAVLIGRNPKVAASAEGAAPQIMKFDGPGQGLSRTHAEVRVESGDVVVEDLQSTNGTDVQLPGERRRRLNGGEPVVIVPGTLIDFGDELQCTFEAVTPDG